MPIRGRPIKIDKNKVIELLINYKNQIIFDNGKIISKCDLICLTLSKQIDDCMTPNALYTFVVCNRYNIRDRLMNTSSDKQNVSNDSMKNEDYNSSNNKSSINESTTSRDSCISQSNTETIFTINIPKNDFQDMIIYKKYRKTDKHNRTIRHYTVLQPGMWQHVLCQKIWEATKLSCGFNFKNHKLTRDGQSGYANGAAVVVRLLNAKLIIQITMI